MTDTQYTVERPMNVLPINGINPVYAARLPGEGTEPISGQTQ